MLLVASKKMSGWSDVKKERGLVPAAEVAPYEWAHRFLSQEALKLSSCDDAPGKVSFPWLNLVVRGENSKKFKWNKSSAYIQITEDGKRISHSRQNSFDCAVATLGQVEQGSHSFQVRILEPGASRIMIGWSYPGVALTSSYSDNKGCAWSVLIAFEHS